MIRLAIGIPTYGDPKSKFMYSTLVALNHLHSAKIVDAEGNDVPIEVEIIMVSGSALTESRTRILGEALSWGATHLLWLDADHVFPPDAFLRLLSHNKDVVGCNYARRNIPTAPVAAKTVTDDPTQDNRNLVYTTLEKAQAGELEEVDHTGFGVCLMNMAVVDMLQAKADADGEASFLPLFKFSERPNGGGLIGEDAFFFEKVRNAGGKVYIDHALSWEVGHIHEHIITNAHAVAQKDRWEENTRKIAARFAPKEG
jgi:hypothetical protein